MYLRNPEYMLVKMSRYVKWSSLYNYIFILPGYYYSLKNFHLFEHMQSKSF